MEKKREAGVKRSESSMCMLTYCKKFSASEFVNQNRPGTKKYLSSLILCSASCPAALHWFSLIKVDVHPRSMKELS